MQAHIFISGTVQGVSFRQFIKSNASRLGLTGWVRNTPARNATQSVAGGEDGGVEAVFCGEKVKIEQMIELCRKGPMLAEVKQVGFEREEPEQFSDFTIR